jgi:hypothetical protein
VLDHESRVDRVGDRTLVEVVVENATTVDRRVRVENRLDGRVEPPRESGVPAPGWDEDGYAGVVPADDRLTLGYACAAPPADPPVAVHDEGRPDDEADETTAADAVRLLGDHAPPADAVSVEAGRDGAATGQEDVAGDGGTTRAEGAVGDEGANGADDSSSDAASAPSQSTDSPPEPVAAMVDRLDDWRAATGSTATTDGVPDVDGSARDGPAPADPSPPPAADPAEPRDERTPTAPDDLPPAVASWVADARARVADAEALAAGDLQTVARVAEERGGAAEAAALAERLDDDERALRALAAAAEDLADRAAAAEVPVAALRRLS